MSTANTLGFSNPKLWLGAGFQGLGAGLEAAGGVNRSGTQTTTPNLSPLQQQLMDQILGTGENILGSDPNLTGYEAEGLKNIGQQGQDKNALLQRTLAARGLTNSPLAAGAQIASDQANQDQATSFTNNIPLLKQQLLLQNLSGVSSAFRNTPFGSTETSNMKQSAGGLGTAGAVVNGIGSVLGALLKF